MSEQKQVRRVKVLTTRSIFTAGEDGKVKKTPAGQIVMLTAEEIKHFGKAVTKDLPEGEE